MGQPDDERPEVKGVETDEKGDYVFKNLPAGDYKLYVGGEGAPDREGGPRDRQGGQRRHEGRQGRPRATPYLNLYASQKVFLPNETPKVELHGFTPQKEVRMRVVRLDDDKIAQKGGYATAIGPLARSEEAANLAGLGKAVIDTKEAVTERDAEGAFVQTLPVGALKEGVYFVDCRAGEQKANTVLLVSHLALVTKTGADGTLLYTTDLKTGKPVAGAEILARERRTRCAKIGVTGADGTLQAELPAPNVAPPVMARKGASVAIVDSYSRRARPSEGLGRRLHRAARLPSRRHGVLQGLRAPRSTATATACPASGDGRGRRSPIRTATSFRSCDLPLSAHGSFNGEFTTSKEGKPGAYDVQCKAIGGEGGDLRERRGLPQARVLHRGRARRRTTTRWATAPPRRWSASTTTAGRWSARR